MRKGRTPSLVYATRPALYRYYHASRASFRFVSHLNATRAHLKVVDRSPDLGNALDFFPGLNGSTRIMRPSLS